MGIHWARRKKEGNIERGFFDGLNGIAPHSPFAYAPDESASLSIRYDLPVANGGNVLLGTPRLGEAQPQDRS